MSTAKYPEVNWFNLNTENDPKKITHFCGGSTDEKKNNKPKETQTEMTKWFNPTTFDEETKVSKCRVCGEEHKHDEPLITLGEN